MSVKVYNIKDNVFMRDLFYNKNIDMLFDAREYEFSCSDIGERIFRKMIMDTILFWEKDVLSYKAMRNPSEVLKDNLKNDYSAFIGYVDSSLKGKEFSPSSYDSYDKAIECGTEIYTNINSYSKVRKK